MNTKAFTLIELLVVVLIIGVLAAVVLPQYQKAVLKSRFTEIETNMQTLVRASERYYLEHDAYPTDISQLDIEIPSCPVVPGAWDFCKWNVNPGLTNVSLKAIGEEKVFVKYPFKEFSSGPKTFPANEIYVYGIVPENIRNAWGFTICEFSVCRKPNTSLPYGVTGKSCLLKIATIVS